MARALVLQGNPSPDEQENVRWQTLQVSTLSIASCFGRIFIGICLSECYYIFCDGQNLLSDRCNRRLWQAQGDEARLVSLHGGHVLPRLSVGWPSHSGHRTLTIRGFLGWDFVRWGVRPLTDYHHRMVWNGYAQPFVSIGTAGANLPFGVPFPTVAKSLHTAHFSGNWGLVSTSPLVAGNIFSMIFGRIFDAHSSYNQHGMHCLEGERCYSTSLYVTILACLCALVLALVAVKRDKRYR